jgi:hypothetical protein
MNSRLLHQRPLPVNWAILPILALLTSAGFLAAQASFSAGPLLLHQVRMIYVAPSSDDFVLLVKARLEKWAAVGITSKPEEADAILTCQTESTIVPAKMVVRRTIAEVTLRNPFGGPGNPRTLIEAYWQMTLWSNSSRTGENRPVRIETL